MSVYIKVYKLSRAKSLIYLLKLNQYTTEIIRNVFNLIYIDLLDTYRIVNTDISSK